MVGNEQLPRKYFLYFTYVNGQIDQNQPTWKMLQEEKFRSI